MVIFYKLHQFSNQRIKILQFLENVNNFEMYYNRFDFNLNLILSKLSTYFVF